MDNGGHRVIVESCAPLSDAEIEALRRELAERSWFGYEYHQALILGRALARIRQLERNRVPKNDETCQRCGLPFVPSGDSRDGSDICWCNE